MNLAITWDVTPEIIDGWKTPNLYGLLFVTGLIFAFLVVKRMYKREGMSEDTLDKLVIYMVLATIIGARLGHVFFYGPLQDAKTIAVKNRLLLSVANGAAPEKKS